MVTLEGSLYDALGVAKDASQADIRKAYLKLAVTLHPDKNGGDAQATERFQTLQKVYGILSDPDKRKVYDRTGSVEDSEELAGGKFNDLYDYYRGMFAQVTEEDIDKFHQGYRGSQEERADVLRYYRQFQGDMSTVFEWVMCSSTDLDSHRFMDLIEGAIQAKEVPATKKFTAWAKKVAARPQPDPLAPPKRGKKGGGRQQQQQDEMALIAQIRGKRQSVFDGMLLQLAAKYGGGGGESEENEPYNEPSEEEFQAARRRLEGKRGGSKAGAAAAAGGSSKAAKRTKL